MIKEVAFTMYPVVDMVRARDFYKNILKLEVGHIYKHSGGICTEYDLPEGRCLVLTTLAKGVTPSVSSGGNIAFEVEDLKIKDVKSL